MGQAQAAEKPKRSRHRKLLIWLAVDAVVAVTVIGLLLYRPSQYQPVVAADTSADPNGQTVHPYLHRDLGSTFYNESQKRRPFEIVVLDEKLNEAIAQNRWQSEGVELSAPQVLFTPERITLMGTADVEGAKFVVTIELNPLLDGKGYLSFAIAKVKVGAMNVTPLAKLAAREMYRKEMGSGPVEVDNLSAKIVASLLNEEPFDPLMEVGGKWVRLKGFDLTSGRLALQFVPGK
jgi:hypothetical protein